MRDEAAKKVKMKMKTIIVSLVLALAGVVVSQTLGRSGQTDQVWKNIKLLHSKVEDAERVLPKPDPPAPASYMRHYSLKDYELFIEYYSFDHCRPSYGYIGEWNVPEWTVTEIVYVPAESISFDTLNINLKGFKKVYKSPHVPSMASYINDSKGVQYTLETDGESLHDIRYFPSRQYNRLRCKQ